MRQKKNVLRPFAAICALLCASALACTPAAASILDEDPLEWRLSFGIDQDRLRFSSLWFEFSRFDEGLTLDTGPRAFNDDPMFSSFGSNDRYFYPQDMDMFHMTASQRWGRSGFSTIERYARYEMEKETYDEWGIGVGFRYNPKLYFEFTYNDSPVQLRSDDRDRQLRFRTMISF